MLYPNANLYQKIKSLEASRSVLMSALNDVKEWFEVWDIPIGSAEEALLAGVDQALFAVVKAAEGSEAA